MSDQAPVDPAFASDLPPAGTVGQTTAQPTPIGVPKYQTIGGAYVYIGTKNPRVVEGVDAQGKPAWYAVDASGNIKTDADGAPVTDTPVTDHSGNPQRAQAVYATPGSPGTELPNITSRIEPGSPAAQVQPGNFGPARYQTGAETEIWYGLPVEMRQQVMEAMAARGLAPTSGTSSGIDANWVHAFNVVLSYANTNNLDWMSALRYIPPADKTATFKPQDYTITLDSPADLGAIFRKSAAQLVGGGVVGQADIDRFVSAVQGQERADQQAQIAQKQAAAAQPAITTNVDAGGNPVDATGTPVALPSTTTERTALASPEQYAQDYIRQHFASQVSDVHVANAYNLLLGSMSNLGRASTTGSTP